jgi:hypothetical protein
VTQFSVLYCYQHFGRIHFSIFILKMEVADFSEP